MAYLGRDGVLKLQRNPPDPIVVPVSAINKASNYITVDYDDWLLAEYACLIHSSGYIEGFIYRDTLDRIYFHTTREGALSNSASTRISFTPIALTRAVVIAVNINTTQRSTLITFQSTVATQTYERTLRGWPTVKSTFIGQATANPWTLQGEIKNWELSRSAADIDTGCLGEKFTSTVKSTLSGSGKIDFLVSLYTRENYNDVDPLLRLVNLVEEGSTALVKFYLKKQSAPSVDIDSWGTTVTTTSSLFFLANILITSSSVSVAAEDLIYGSAGFVTSGPIRLLSE